MNEMTYTQVGDYRIPDIELKNTETKPLGKYGRMRRAFLQENNPMLLNDLILSEQLFPHLQEIDETAHRRVTKESFERWYASQTDYRTVEDQELDADIMASTYGLPEMARMLGVHRQTIYYIVANEDFELIKVGRYKRATKESFEKWYQNQTRYQLAEDRQERS